LTAKFRIEQEKLTTTRFFLCVWLSFSLVSCSDLPDAPKLTLTSVDGTVIEINEESPLTALVFFSVSNPVALGTLDRLPDELDEAADSIAIAMHVDRPPNITIMQQRTLVPIVIDDANRISEVFGNINLTPTLILVNKGKIHFQQHGRIDFDSVNNTIQTLQ
jgi:hypothetical protein